MLNYLNTLYLFHYLILFFKNIILNNLPIKVILYFLIKFFIENQIINLIYKSISNKNFTLNKFYRKKLYQTKQIIVY